MGECLDVNIGCPDEYWPNYSIRKCVECSTGCLTCLSSLANSCFSCTIGYYLYINECVSSCPSSGYFGDGAQNKCNHIIKLIKSFTI